MYCHCFLHSYQFYTLKALHCFFLPHLQWGFYLESISSTDLYIILGMRQDILCPLIFIFSSQLPSSCYEQPGLECRGHTVYQMLVQAPTTTVFCRTIFLQRDYCTILAVLPYVAIQLAQYLLLLFLLLTQRTLFFWRLRLSWQTR